MYYKNYYSKPQFWVKTSIWEREIENFSLDHKMLIEKKVIRSSPLEWQSMNKLNTCLYSGNSMAKDPPSGICPTEKSLRFQNVL